jgi:hypothetical protein
LENADLNPGKIIRTNMRTPKMRIHGTKVIKNATPILLVTLPPQVFIIYMEFTNN